MGMTAETMKKKVQRANTPVPATPSPPPLVFDNFMLGAILSNLWQWILQLPELLAKLLQRQVYGSSCMLWVSNTGYHNVRCMWRKTPSTSCTLDHCTSAPAIPPGGWEAGCVHRRDMIHHLGWATTLSGLIQDNLPPVLHTVFGFCQKRESDLS